MVVSSLFLHVFFLYFKHERFSLNLQVLRLRSKLCFVSCVLLMLIPFADSPYFVVSSDKIEGKL